MGANTRRSSIASCSMLFRQNLPSEPSRESSPDLPPEAAVNKFKLVEGFIADHDVPRFALRVVDRHLHAELLDHGLFHRPSVGGFFLGDVAFVRALVFGALRLVRTGLD